MSSRVESGAVLVGVDGSADSCLALAWAGAHARDRGLPLAVVHAVAPPLTVDAVVDALVDPVVEEGLEAALLAAGRALVDAAVAAVLGDGVLGDAMPVDVHVELGDPRFVAAGLAEDASILVVGSRGRGPVSSLLLGSVSVALAAHAPCAVAVVRAGHEPVDAPDVRPVVLGIDEAQLEAPHGPRGSREHTDVADPARTVRFGIELASTQERPLEVVHAVRAYLPFPYPDLAAGEVVQRYTDEAGQRLAACLADPMEHYPDVEVRSRVVVESPVHALVDASEHAAVVVVGCRGRGPARSRLLGSVSRSVVELAHCTVVVVRDGAA